MFLRSKVNTNICAVVKANAYGHGLKAVSEYIKPFVDELAVATLDEAKILATSVKKPINILGNIDKSRLDPYNFSNIFPTVASLDDIKYLLNQQFTGKVNVKFNSGMNRLGANIYEIKDVVNALYCNQIPIKSMFSHFYNSNDSVAIKKQFTMFSNLQKDYKNATHQFHICASSCLDLPQEYHLDMVRVGLALYGYGNVNLCPAMSVKTNILQIITALKGENIGYGNYKARHDCKIASIRAGYGDGFRRISDSKRFVSVCGKLRPILGQVCMDICMVDVTNLPINIDTPIYLLDDVAPIEKLAKSYKTINYEVLTSFNDRARRVYVK